MTAVRKEVSGLQEELLQERTSGQSLQAAMKSERG